jgi:hypothetical protein
MDNRLGILRNYNWDVFLSKKDLKIIDRRKNISEFARGIEKFAKQFSPNEGFLGFKGRKKRTEEDAIEFMVQTGLVNSSEETKEFFNLFGESGVIDIPLEYGKYTTKRLILEKYNEKGQTLYKVKFWRDDGT